jgi:hypothetical protein
MTGRCDWSGERHNRPLTRVGTSPVYSAPLQVQWKARTDEHRLRHLLMPETLTVRVDTNDDGKPDRTLKRVERTARLLGRIPAWHQPGPGYTAAPPNRPSYGCIRLPYHLAGDERWCPA